MSSAQTTLSVLQATYPGRVALSPKEIAQAIHGADKATKKRVEAVNRALNEGRLIPGLRKTGARWSVPIVALAQALDARSAPVAEVDRNLPGGYHRTRTRRPIGPRMLFRQQRVREALGEILHEVARLRSLAENRDREDATGPAKAPSRPPLRP